MYDLDRLYECFEKMASIMGEEELLNSIFKALSTDEKVATLEYIDRMHNLGVFNNKVDGDEDEE
jgi:hypothetical protein